MNTKNIARDAVNALLDSGPYVIVVTSALTAIAAILSLLLVDIYTGQITSEHISTDKYFGWIVSLATTGLLTAAFATLWKGVENKWSPAVIWGVGIITILLICVDTYFDSLAVDIKRFGSIVVVREQLPIAEATAHFFFRGLVGGISLVGEPLAAASIVIFPALREFFNKWIANRDKVPSMDRRDNDRPRFPQPNTARPVGAPGGGYRPVGGNSPISPELMERMKNANAKPVPPAASRPLYNEPTYHPIGMKSEGDK